MPALDGLHHVKLPVVDGARSARWYHNVELGLRQLDADERSSLVGFDPIAFAVPAAADLEEWVVHFDALGVDHGPVVDGTIGRLVSIRDPDGIEIKLYSGRRAAP
jgi:catechol 2,3-dioxygenase-like lactoylglutathione lyase family enzyme